MYAHVMLIPYTRNYIYVCMYVSSSNYIHGIPLPACPQYMYNMHVDDHTDVQQEMPA